MFESTFDNLVDVISFDRNSKFFKPEIIKKVEPNQTLIDFYRNRDTSTIQGLQSMGSMTYESTEDLLVKLEKLRADGSYWQAYVQKSLETVDKRASTNFLSRVLMSNLVDRSSNLESTRLKSPFYQQVWSEYLK